MALITDEEYKEFLMLRELVKKQNIQIENLTQALLHSRKKMFGRSSETTQIDGQMTLFTEELEVVKELAKSQEEIVITEHKRKTRQPGVRADMIKDLPVTIERCIIDESETCPICGNPLKKVGEKVIRSEVQYVPASVKVIQYIQEVYKCTVCGTEKSDNEKNTFVEAQLPKPVLSHSLASASLVAGILYKKYDMGIPLARQERDWYRLGLYLYRSTMANWVIRCSEDWLLPIYERMHEKILACTILHGDETSIQCNREPGKKASSKSYMWVIKTGKSEEIAAVLFHYSRNRNRETAGNLYKGFRGYLITDAYTGYDKLEGVKRALCWSHVRRYWVDSIPLDSKGKELKGSMGAVGREWCDKLFAIEKKIIQNTPQERIELRNIYSRPILEDFFEWVETTSRKFTTNEALTTALTYTKNQKDYLMTFLEDGRIPLSNNDCESCIRPFATGRKSWLFADSVKGATASGIVYSLVETAKLNHLDIFKYLSYILEQLPNIEFQKYPELLDSYLPWSSTLPDDCRIKERNKK